VRARRLAAALALLATSTGCRVLVELVESGDAADAGGPDALVVDPDCGAWTFAPASLDACDLPAPGPALVLGPGVWSFDSNSGALTDPAEDASFPTSALVTPPEGPEVRVVSVERFELAAGATLRVHGKRPLVIVAWTIAEIEGDLDATSRLGRPAAGADPEPCAATAATAGAEHVEGAGGGGGGGFAEAGAAGGTGNDGVAAGGGGGMAAAAAVAPRGGCAGAAGGNPLGGAGGPGGGAIYVAARDQLRVDGVIRAGGAGGGAALGGRAGGGGGGSGGFIGLAAPSIALGAAAIVAANGGGGGGGSDGNPALPGESGLADAAPAPPGAGQGMGAGGGAGGALDAAPDPGLPARRGGGGGGGGVGWIAIAGESVDVARDAILSPAP
jgi:hypothetical protein